MSYFEDNERMLTNVPRHLRHGAPQQHEPISAVGMDWTTANGDKLLIADMTRYHLDNAYKAIGRRIGRSEERPQDILVYALLQAEKNRREDCES